MSAETPTPKTPQSLPIIPPFEKGGLGGISNSETIQLLTNHLDIWTAAETEKKSGRGRSSGNGTSVYGVKKLRELIFELAVRGKLVPQDPNDEPASELLKHIQAEKAKLIAEGKIKKDKPLPPITDKDKPFELPKGWEWVRLGDISRTVQYGYTDSANHQSRDVLFLRITDIQNDAVNWATVPGCCISLSDSHSYSLQNNDLVIARTGGTIGKSYLVTGLSQPAVFASYLIRIGNLFSTYAEYKKVFLGSILYWKQLIASSMGTGQPNVNGTALKNLIFPLPPIEEQHRIVAKVDELMALCDQLETQNSNAAAAHEKLVSYLLGTLTQAQSANDFSTNWQRIAAHFDTLFTTESSIDTLKQTLLQLAVMGKLVPQDPSDEPASELLKRIQTEKAKLIADGKIKRGKPLPPITEDEKPYELPQEWEWVRLDELSQVGTGATPLRTKLEYFNPAVISWVTSGETSIPYIFETEQYVSPLAIKETNLTVYPKGTLIIAMYGQGKTRGQITELMIEACTNQACAAIRLFHTDERHRKFIRYFFEKIYDEIRELAAGGAQPNLNLCKIKETFLPLPPLAEQHRIVAKVDELMAQCNQLKTRITQASQLQQKLAEVLVAQAVSQ